MPWHHQHCHSISSHYSKAAFNVSNENLNAFVMCDRVLNKRQRQQAAPELQPALMEVRALHSSLLEEGAKEDASTKIREDIINTEELHLSLLTETYRRCGKKLAWCMSQKNYETQPVLHFNKGWSVSVCQAIRLKHNMCTSKLHQDRVHALNSG